MIPLPTTVVVTIMVVTLVVLVGVGGNGPFLAPSMSGAMSRIPARRPAGPAIIHSAGGTTRVLMRDR